MMTDKQLIARLLKMQEHPEQTTDEQLRQMLGDEQMHELVEQLAFAKRAFKNEESMSEELPIADEWEKFAANHTEELTNAAREEEEEDESQLNALDEENPKSRFALRLSIHKIAASFIGAVLASGIALAAIHIWSLTPSSSPKVEGSSYMQTSDTIKHPQPLSNQRKAGVEATIIFDNMPLDTMLVEMADYYHVSVKFEREEARQLRFHFVWKRTDDLNRLVEKLNNFDAVDIIREPERLIVR